jgi:chromosome partitioning protein
VIGVILLVKVCIINKKGGVAKTTTALAIAAGLIKKGKKVLSIDLDSQCNLTMCTGAQLDGKNVLGVLLEQVSITDAIQKTPMGDVLPACLALAGADGVITETGKEYRLREALNAIEDEYDYAIIDTPPSLGVLSINAMTAADWIVIPAQADIFSRDGLMQLARAIDKDRKYCNKNLKIAGIVLTRYSDRNILSRNLRKTYDDIAAQMGTKVLSSTIRENIAIKEAQVMHQTIFDYDKNSNGAHDYRNLVNELLKLFE